MLLQSIDGFIAEGNDDNLSWGSSEDKRFFKEKSTEIGNIIMGFTTYKTMPPKVFETRNWFILAENENDSDKENIKFVSGDIKNIIKNLEEQGIEKLLIGGGSNVYSQFINAELVDEMFITIAPVVLGSGIRAFNSNAIRKFKLEETSNLTDQEIVLHYTKLDAE